ncbi:MAG: DUF2723 domain-containing protein [Muribaculaceae bacterium]|nr:DUF2723 domain-containing protein [Muribaculaceae bacterium]
MDEEISLSKYLVIMGSGVVGALAYCWSDTFWFSAVEGEVYAFSSFCTALVFWLILKWENRADKPHSDRYLILIAYVIGVSIAVHLLNLLCIPAIVLVFAYRKWNDMNLKKSIFALLISFVIIALVLFGLVPGFIKMAQRFELFFVNGLHCSFNTGALVYAFVAAGVFIWALAALRARKSPTMIKVSFFIAILISGMLFMGSGWLLGWILMACLAAWLFFWKRPLPVRTLTIVMWSVAVIFVGYSSYALILIRSSADTPMNQNSPDNVFDLASYLSREQYGETPLLYGETINSGVQKQFMGYQEVETGELNDDGTPFIYSIPAYTQRIDKGNVEYVKGVRNAEPKESEFMSKSDVAGNAALANRGGDFYVKKGYKEEPKLNPELNMFFPRIYSRMHRDAYRTWVNLDTTSANLKELYAEDKANGSKVPEYDLNGQPTLNPMTNQVVFPQKIAYRPTYLQNFSYFFNYQLIHMYMRYFMWNFAGRQNDLLNQQGELDAGNWISGIPFIDNARLGDQSLLPDDLGKDNQGHNVYYMLPLILGIIGLVWQSFAGKRGIEQFWVVFFLFFMTGIAIVLYLNQPPLQPRERDYAFAGSFYAFAIWIGMGVAGLWSIVRLIMGSKAEKAKAAEGDDSLKEGMPLEEPENPLEDNVFNLEEDKNSKGSLYAAIVACIIGLVIPAQMVSQTWDDHDRSGRYAARDFAVNYLESLEPNAIVFCNGDNDTFPLWYAQEVEGVRPDVKIVNLSYLASDWYANQQMKQSYEAAPVKFTAKPEDIAYGKADVTVVGRERAPMDLLTALKAIYAGKTFNADYGYPEFPSSVVTIPVDKKAVIKRGLVAAKDSDRIVDKIVIDLASAPSISGKGYVSLSELLMFDIIATNAAEGWPRPIYWCSSVGSEYHTGLTNYLVSTGMTHQLVPTLQEGLPARTDRAYDVVTKKYQWGGADKATAEWRPYFDETARRMLMATRNSILDVAQQLIIEGDDLKAEGKDNAANKKYKEAMNALNLIENNLGEAVSRYGITVALALPDYYGQIADATGNKALRKKAADMLYTQMERMMQYVAYNNSIAQQFGPGMNMTTESRYVPYHMQGFIDAYERYGGDSKKVDALLKKFGFTRDYFQRLNAAAYGGAEEAPTVESVLQEVKAFGEIVNSMASMDPSEYAAAPLDQRYIDSVFYGYVQEVISAGVTQDEMNRVLQETKVDMARSKRIYEEYERIHPE